MKRVILILALFVFFVNVFGQSHVITGKLINGRGTAEKMHRVRIELFFDNGQIGRTYTDEQGAFQLDFVTGVEERPATVENYQLRQNFPNPFSGITKIQYALPAGGVVTLEIFNVLGQKVRTLQTGAQRAGIHAVFWDGRDEIGNQCRAGTYFYRFRYNGITEIRKMCLLNTAAAFPKNGQMYFPDMLGKIADNQLELKISDRDLQDTTLVLNYDPTMAELDLGNIRVHVFPFLRERPDTLSLMSGESITDTLNIYFEKPFTLKAKDSEIHWEFTSDSLVEVTYFHVSKSPVWLQIQEIGVPNVTYGMAYFEISPRLGLAMDKLRYGFVGVDYEDSLRIKNCIGDYQLQLISSLPADFNFTDGKIIGLPSDTLSQMLYVKLIDDRQIEVADSAQLIVWYPEDIDVNAYVLDILHEYPRDGTHPYKWVDTYDGVTRDLFYKSERIARANPDGSKSCYCCGLTYEVFFRAVEQLNADLRTGEDLNNLTPGDMRYLKYLWFVQSTWGDGPGVGMEFYGLGDKITDWDEVRPGDFVQLWRTSGSGHSVIFIDWVRDINGEPMGIYYWSTQGSTNGINFNTEYFSGKGGSVNPNYTYFSRVRSPEKFTPFLRAISPEFERIFNSDKPIFPKSFMRNE